MKKLLTIIVSIMMISLLAFGLVACGPKGNDENGDNGGQTPHVCEFTATEWWDKTGDKLFPKKLACSCGESKSQSMEIDSADKLIKWSEYINANKYYHYEVKITQTIDMQGKTYTPVNVNYTGSSNSGVYVITGAEGVSIKNLTVSSSQNAGFIATASSKLKVTDLTIESATISGENAGGLIGCIDNAIDVKVNDCIVKSSTITGTATAGGMYGVMSATDSTNAEFKGVTIQGNTISSEGYAGSVCGKATDCELGQNGIYVINLTISNDTVKNNTIASTQVNGAGVLFGYIGFGNVKFSSQHTSSADANSATCNQVENERFYGRTGWLSVNEKGVVLYDPLTYLQFNEAENAGAN